MAKMWGRSKAALALEQMRRHTEMVNIGFDI